MTTPSAKMASTLRLFTRNGREETFATTLVEDSYTRPLRALVDGGFLTMDYTGTRRVYTLTSQGRDYLEAKRMGKKRAQTPKPVAPAVAAAPEQPRTNGHKKERSPQKREAIKTAPPSPEPRKKKTAERNVHPPMSAVPQLRSSVSVTALDVIRLMREVRDYADAHEGVDALLAMILRVEELAQRFGGLECVRESLQAIREFRQER